ERDDVDLLQGVPHEVVEPLAEQRPGTVQPWGVDEDELGVGPVDDATHDVPRRLRSTGGDGDLLPDKGVGQRRLAGVRPPDEAGEPRTELPVRAVVAARAGSLRAHGSVRGVGTPWLPREARKVRSSWRCSANIS